MQKLFLMVGVVILSFSGFAKDVQPMVDGEKLQALSWEKIGQNISQGKVTYATVSQVYFNVGLVNGLRPSDTVEFFRKNTLLGSCHIDQVADHTSYCTFSNARVGDDVIIRQTVHLQKKQISFQAMPDEKTLESINTIVRKSTFTKVIYTATQVSSPNSLHMLGNFPFRMTAQHQTWSSSSESTFQIETVSLILRDAPLGTEKLTTNIDLSTSYWKPNERRFRANDDLQLYVWESSIRYRSSEKGLSVTAGRIRPWDIPGMGPLDGAQLDIPIGRFMTVGLYGGVTPTATTLGLSKEQTQSGVYVENEIIHSRTFLLRQQSRVGFTNSQGFGHNIDFENILFANVRRLISSYAQMKFNLLGENKTRLDYLDLDMSITPIEHWIFRVSGRVVKHIPDEYAFINFYESRRAETSASWKALDWLSISALAGYVEEQGGDGLDHLYIGPEISLRQRIINSKYGGTIGHQQEWGWIGGHMTYIRPYVQVTNDLRVIPQVTYTHEIQALAASNEWGTGISCMLTALRWLDFSGSFYSRFGDGPSGMGGLLSITGRL